MSRNESSEKWTSRARDKGSVRDRQIMVEERELPDLRSDKRASSILVTYEHSLYIEASLPEIKKVVNSHDQMSILQSKQNPYGDIDIFRVQDRNSHDEPTSLFVKFRKNYQAALLYKALNFYYWDHMKGTTRFCFQFLKGYKCKKSHCNFLHEEPRMARFYYEGEVQNFVFDNQLALELIYSNRDEIRSRYSNVKTALDFLSPVQVLNELDEVNEESIEEDPDDEGDEETEYSESEIETKIDPHRKTRSESSDGASPPVSSCEELDPQEPATACDLRDEYEELAQSINDYVHENKDNDDRPLQDKQIRKDSESFGFFIVHENLRFLNDMGETCPRQEDLTKRDISFQSSSSTEPYSCITSNWGIEEVEEFILFPLHTVEDAFADLVGSKGHRCSQPEERMRLNSHPEYPTSSGFRDSEPPGLSQLNKSLVSQNGNPNTAVSNQASQLLRHGDISKSSELDTRKPLGIGNQQSTINLTEASKKLKLELVCEESINLSPSGLSKAMRKKQRQMKKKQEKKARFIDMQLCKTNSEQTDLFDMSDIHRKASVKQEDDRDSDEDTEIFRLMETKVRLQNEQQEQNTHLLLDKPSSEVESLQTDAKIKEPEVMMLATQPKKKRIKPKKKQAAKQKGKKEESGLSSFQQRLLEESPPDDKEEPQPQPKKPGFKEKPRVTPRLFNPIHSPSDSIHFEENRRYKQGIPCSELDFKYVITNLKVTQSMPSEFIYHLIEKGSSTLRMKNN